MSMPIGAQMRFGSLILFAALLISCDSDEPNRPIVTEPILEENAVRKVSPELWQIEVGQNLPTLAVPSDHIVLYQPERILIASLDIESEPPLLVPRRITIASRQGMLDRTPADHPLMMADMMSAQWKSSLVGQWGSSEYDYGLEKIEIPADKTIDHTMMFHSQWIIGPVSEMFFGSTPEDGELTFILCTAYQGETGPCMITVHFEGFYIVTHFPRGALTDWHEIQRGLEHVAINLPVADITTDIYRFNIGSSKYEVPKECLSTFAHHSMPDTTSAEIRVHYNRQKGVLRNACITPDLQDSSVIVWVMQETNIMAKFMVEEDGSFKCRVNGHQECRLAARFGTDKVAVLYLPKVPEQPLEDIWASLEALISSMEIPAE